MITGEGRIDAQTAFGKTALGVARRAHAAGVRCIAVGGGVEAAGVAALAPLGVEVVAVNERDVPVAEAMAAGAAPVVACGERLARARHLARRMTPEASPAPAATLRAATAPRGTAKPRRRRRKPARPGPNLGPPPRAGPGPASSRTSSTGSPRSTASRPGGAASGRRAS